ncbi:hypothetical protein ACIQM4_15215 [Streptomyces sp. NPDC091272]|uniref:hypothetical protein n=1 Tax=Streptomyces sp. NPDC091272 TaxID=3365981 RepID=UPI0037FCABF4
MAGELGELAGLLERAARTSLWTGWRWRIAQVVTTAYGPHVADRMPAGPQAPVDEWYSWLQDLAAADPEGSARVRRDIAEACLDRAWDGGALPRSFGVGADAGAVIRSVPSATVQSHVTGDNVDLTGNTVNGQVIGFQSVHHAPPATYDRRPVGQVGPVEFGVRPTRRVVGLPDVPPYVERDVDRVLAARLARSGLVVLLAKPLSGASHTAWNAVRQMDGHQLYAPEPGTDLRTLPADLKYESGAHVLWLDDLTGHLGNGGLTPGLLGRLAHLGVVVLATMDPDAHHARRTERVLAAAHTVPLERGWSEKEFAGLASFVADGRVAEVHEHGDRAQVAAHFAFGHLLRDEWHHPGARTAHPRGCLLVRAAVDLAMCGVEGPVSESLLARLSEGHAAGSEGPAGESYGEAFAWAGAERFSIPGFGLLVRGRRQGSWKAHGAVVAGEWPVLHEVWDRVRHETRDDPDVDSEALTRAYCETLRPRAEAGETSAMVRLGRAVPERTEALAWYRRAADAGSIEAAAELGVLLTESPGSEQEAIKYLETAATAGHLPSARALGGFLRDWSDRWLGVAAATESDGTEQPQPPSAEPPGGPAGEATEDPVPGADGFRIDLGHAPPAWYPQAPDPVEFHIDYAPPAWYLRNSASPPEDRGPTSAPGSG